MKSQVVRMGRMQSDLQLGVWRVQPQLNSLVCDLRTVRLEPKMMGVLLCLAQRSGDVVSKEQIVEEVWQGTFVTDDVLIRCVSELRKAFGDNAGKPTFIETIPRRGYRLLIPAVPIAQADHHEAPSTPEFADSIAILPFENSGSDLEMEYLSEGVAETMINSLSRLQDLRVVPRTTVFRHKKKEIDPIRTGRELGSRVVLKGEVVQRGDGLIIRVELIDAAKGSLVWGEKYDCKPRDILAVQQEIVREVLSRLHLRGGETERGRLNRAPTESREAYLLFLKAVHFANKLTPEGCRKGFHYTRQAIDADPTYALAYTSLANLYLLLAYFGDAPPSETFPKAKAAAIKALDIDESLADAHAALAFVQLVYDWDWQSSHAELCRAIKLGPNVESGHYVLSHWYITRQLCQEAITEAKVALSIDPLSAKLNFHLGAVHYLARHYYEAIEEFRKTLELDPLFPGTHQLLACAYARTGMWQDAMAESEQGLALCGGSLRGRGRWAAAHALIGRHLDARKVLEELKQESGAPHFQHAFVCASLHALLGERDESFEWLDKALLARAGNLVYLGLDPHFESLHGDTRFGDLLCRIGLPA
jgi:TolB-like protein/Tfp pilus assembly protein PilF